MAERESSTYLVWRNEKAPLHARESAYTTSLLAVREWRDMGDAKDKHQPGAVPIPCYWPAASTTSAYSSSNVSQGLEPPTSAT